MVKTISLGLLIIAIGVYVMVSHKAFQQQDFKDSMNVVKLVFEVVVLGCVIFYGHVLATEYKDRELKLKQFVLAVDILRDADKGESKEIKEWALRIFREYSTTPVSDQDIERLRSFLNVHPSIYQAINKVFTDRGLPSPGLTSNIDAQKLFKTKAIEEWMQKGGGHVYILGPVAINASAEYQLEAYNQQNYVQSIGETLLGKSFMGKGTKADPYLATKINSKLQKQFKLRFTITNEHSKFILDSDYETKFSGTCYFMSFDLSDIQGEKLFFRNSQSERSIEVVLSESVHLLVVSNWNYLDPNYTDKFNYVVYLIVGADPST